MTALTFERGHLRVRDLGIEGERDVRSGKLHIRRIDLNGESLKPTRRFWKSFFMRFGISDKVFRYFEPEEVFARISERAADDLVRFCIERSEDDTGKLLAVSSPHRPYIAYDEIRSLVKRYDGQDVNYEEGMLSSTHTPRGGNRTFEIRGDRFQHRFVMETPVDGFGHPRIHLSFLRLVCSNGAIGYSRAFRSDVSMGKNIRQCISRALDSFDNGDGYAALRQRFESAQSSWASVHESYELYKMLSKLESGKNLTSKQAFENYYQMTGNLNAMYGLANLDAISRKRQRILPAKCRVYDLLNFASEIGTHHATPAGNRAMQAYIGSLISDEYDMEGTANAGEFRDFFVDQDQTAPPFSKN